MRVDITKITSAINKISDLTSGDKIIPGVMLTLDTNKLDVCYSDGHKSLIETLEVETNETDKMGSVVVDFEQIRRAISNCQPSGIIKVSDVYFTYGDKTLVISADQVHENKDENGNVTSAHKLGKKSMSLIWNEPGADMKSAILSRMKYDEIFVSDGTTDEFDRKELIDALSKTSIEKGKQIYFSTKTQTIFVANQAHLTAVPISSLGELSLEDQDILRADLNEKGMFTEENFANAIAERQNRMHYSVCVNQSVAKSIIGILSKTDSEKVYLHCKDKACNIFVDSNDERVGIWFEMAQASKAHIGTLERYNALNYNSYRVTFLREFLADSIKSAINSTKSEKIAFKFEQDEADGMLKLVIASGSSAASINDVYKVAVETSVDSTSDLISKTFNVSLKVFADMLGQLKTDRVSLDFECGADGSTCVRLSELDYARLGQEYTNAQAKAAQMGAETIPVELKLEALTNSLLTKQYTMLAK